LLLIWRFLILWLLILVRSRNFFSLVQNLYVRSEALVIFVLDDFPDVNVASFEM